MDSIIKAEHITKAFTNHVALDDVSLEVPRGKVYGLLGPNGAGKTTLIRIINHITAPDSGSVMFNGRPLTAADVVNIGYLPEERGLYKKMKVGEQALFFARLKGLGRQEAERSLRQWFERLEISGWWNKKVEELSKGMAQKVQFIVTVLHKPELLIFDEPFSGFDPINANVLKREILKLRDEGATVIFSTHNMSSVEELCDSITLINKSHDILSGKVSDLRRRFSDNSMQMRFAGDFQTLRAAIGDAAASVEQTPPDRDGNSCARIRLHDMADMRQVISLANNAVDLRGFSELLPTMDDIFIRTVEASNSNQQ
ncbi:MAG: ATP-binding cassette domain-containing protein [Muribaculaceae bacterium]|nr:ATP-binding cassette domain-containing protein [Muribaculaceae bacterium]